MNKSVMQLVKSLVSEETFNDLINELHTYEDWEEVYREILKEIDEEDRNNREWDE